jgi:uncharacterized protein YabE (DUF348 family)
MQNRKFVFISVGIVLIGALVLGISLRKDVTIIEDGQPRRVHTWAFTVGGALEAAGVNTDSQDEVSPAIGQRVRKGTEIIVNHAVTVQIESSGSIYTLVTTERTPGELLQMAGIESDSQTKVYYAGKPYGLQDELPAARFYSLSIRPTYEITLVRGDEMIVIKSLASTLGAVLWEAGITLYSADRTSLPLDTVIDKDLTVDIWQSVPLKIQIGEDVIKTRSAANTVGQALVETGFPLQGLDYSIPADDQFLPEDGLIRVVHVEEEIILEQEPIPFSVETQVLPDVDLDTTRIVQVGEYGLKASSVRVRYEDGEPVAQNVETEWVVREPIPRIEGYGSKVTIKTLDTPNGQIEYWRAVEFYATSYAPGLVPNGTGYVACGEIFQPGFVGVDLDYVPCGTRLYIPGYGIGIAMDTGRIKGAWIDLGFADEEYVPWHQNVTVYFLTPVPDNFPLSIPPGTTW